MKFKFEPNEFEVGKEYHGKIVSIEKFPLPADGSLLRAEGNPKVYWMQNEKRRWIETGEIFQKMEKDLGFTQADIRLIKAWQMETIRLGKVISQWPEEQPEPAGEYAWVRGLLTEHPVPSVNQIKGMGFNVIMVFGWEKEEAKLKALADSGIKLIARSQQLPEISPAYEKRHNIMAYFIYDEPEYYYKPSDIMRRIDVLRTRTDLPIMNNFTAHFWMENPDWWKGDWPGEYPKVFEKLDYISFGSYWYRGGGLYQQEYDWAQEAIKRVKAEGKALIGIAQGHEDALHHITKPDMIATNKVWKDAGAGVIWYAWQKAEAAIGARPGDEWYNEQVKMINSDK